VGHGPGWSTRSSASAVNDAMVRKTALLGKGISYTRLAPRRWLVSLERAGNRLIDAAMHEVVDLVFPIFVRDLVLEDSDQYNGAMTTTWALCIVCLGYVHEESCRLSSTTTCWLPIERVRQWLACSCVDRPRCNNFVMFCSEHALVWEDVDPCTAGKS
jgi:hypothetical protein